MAKVPGSSNSEADEHLVDLLMNEPSFQGAFVGGPPLLKASEVEDMFRNTDAWKAEIANLLEEERSQ